MLAPAEIDGLLERSIREARDRRSDVPADAAEILALPVPDRFDVLAAVITRRIDRGYEPDAFLALEWLEGALFSSFDPASTPPVELAKALTALGRARPMCAHHWRAAWDLSRGVLAERGLVPELYDGLRAMQPAMRAHLSDKNARIAIDKVLWLETHLPLDLDADAAGVVKRELRAMTAAQRKAWTSLVEHAMAGAQGEPKPSWLKTADARIGRIGREAFVERASALLAEIAARPSITLSAAGADVLRGLVWALGAVDGRPGDDAIAALASREWKRSADWSPRHDRFVAALAWALGEARDRDRARAILLALEPRFRRTTAKYALAAAAAKLGSGG